MEDIDIVITWVDGEDPVWLAEKAKYVNESETSHSDIAGKARYHDNGLLKYLFRGIEKFAPWVRKVHFVTYGHLPQWLNKDCEKLHIVNHKDFMPEEYLPTFSSVPLNLNLHRIPGLAERFIYFNDDMFLVSPAEPELFFKNGLPRDMAVMDVLPATDITTYWHMVYNDILMLNKNMNKKKCIKQNRRKWYSFEYGKNMLKNICMSPFSSFCGIYETHLPAGYLRSSYEEVWEKNGEVLDSVSHHKFRDYTDVSENFIRYYQMAKGNFEPINKMKYGRYISMKAEWVDCVIADGRFKYICINDETEGEQFDKTVRAFERILPDACSFETERVNDK